MKLSQHARSVGVTYRTAFRWWQNGEIKGYQLPSGTIVVTEGEDQKISKPGLVAIDTRVSSHEHRAHLERQARRLEVINLAENDREDLLHDLVSVIYPFAARLYGQCRAKRKTEAIVTQLKQEGLGETGRAASDPQE